MIHANLDRQPAGRLNDTCKFEPSAGGPDIHIGPLFKNRKQNIICYDIYGCTINRIYKKNLQYVYLGFSVGVKVGEKLFFECENKSRCE